MPPAIARAGRVERRHRIGIVAKNSAKSRPAWQSYLSCTGRQGRLRNESRAIRGAPTPHPAAARRNCEDLTARAHAPFISRQLGRRSLGRVARVETNDGVSFSDRSAARWEWICRGRRRFACYVSYLSLRLWPPLWLFQPRLWPGTATAAGVIMVDGATAVGATAVGAAAVGAAAVGATVTVGVADGAARATTAAVAAAGVGGMDNGYGPVDDFGDFARPSSSRARAVSCFPQTITARILPSIQYTHPPSTCAAASSRRQACASFRFAQRSQRHQPSRGR